MIRLQPTSPPTDSRFPSTSLFLSIAPDVGGSFGSKIFCYAEETVCIWAAKKVRAPVKWTAERSESFTSDAHGRDHVTHAQLAMDENGKFLGMKVETTANMGAYLSSFATSIPTRSEEHTSEIQSLMSLSYAVFCL